MSTKKKPWRRNYKRELATLTQPGSLHPVCSARSLKCPWPKSVWPMTEKQYVKAVPDPATRTAISGFLMRRGWEVAIDEMEKAQNDKASNGGE